MTEKFTIACADCNQISEIDENDVQKCLKLDKFICKKCLIKAGRAD